MRWDAPHEGIVTKAVWDASRSHGHGPVWAKANEKEGVSPPDDLPRRLAGVRTYTLDPDAIAAAVSLTPSAELQPNGGHLAGVLDRLRDQAPDRFEAINRELHAWLPEFDRILFAVPAQGKRAFELRPTGATRGIPAAELSQGTLLALAILTLAYVPDPPPVACFEEPDRGIHPRLLRRVQDALYRLSHPDASGEGRPAVQVIATTHSPYFLDLFKDHPDEVVIAHKTGLTAKFERLSERKDAAAILEGAPLGEVWFSGVLGGVPQDA